METKPIRRRSYFCTSTVRRESQAHSEEQASKYRENLTPVTVVSVISIALCEGYFLRS